MKTAEEIIDAYSNLSPEEQQKFLQAILERAESTQDDEQEDSPESEVT